MASPREIAEQAYALLQNALRASEARASDLDEQLKRKRVPKNRLEEQLDVLTHRLESLEAESAHWRQQAEQLEDVAEAERTKVAQLKKKLEIAESGPERLTKKEVNFWRGKVEDFDSETKGYKERLSKLLRDLMERDALIEKLQQGAGAERQEAASPAESQDSSELDALRAQLEQREQWLTELRHELHELRAERSVPEPPLETQAEFDTLRHQIASLEIALAEAHNTRAGAQADFERAKHEIEEHESAVREAEAGGERARAMLAEREHKLVELGAELEYLRKELESRDERQRTLAAALDERAYAIERFEQELGEARTLAAEQGRNAESARAELAQLRTALALAERRAADTGTELAHLQTQFAQREQQHAANEDESRQLREALADHEHKLAEQQQRLAAAEAELDQQGAALEERTRALEERDRSLEESQLTLEAVNQTLADREQQLADHERDLGQRSSVLEEQANQLREVEERRQELEEQVTRLQSELETAKAASQGSDHDLANARETLSAQSHDLSQLRAEREKLTSDLEAARARMQEVERELDSAKDQLAGLEAELKDEKEHAANMSQLANERRERVTKLTEQVEEAEERYAEADWRLGKALYFERLVERRKGLIAKLLAALRAKMKANVALKAGVDGLRTYKATAEMNQQKLLQRIEQLKSDLHEAQEAIERHQSATATAKDFAEADSRTAALEERLNTQAELIQTLESDLKAARISQKGEDEKTALIEQLQQELAMKNEVIVDLQADSDDQQRKLAKLRGSESETMRLKALTEKDRTEIDALQREVAQLREALLRNSSSGDTGAPAAELQAKLKERDNALTQLKGTLKEHETTIRHLSEAVEGWKRKYQFLAADEPEAYKNVAEK